MMMMAMVKVAINKYISEQIDKHGKTVLDMAPLAVQHAQCMKKCKKPMDKAAENYEPMWECYADCIDKEV